MGKLNLWDLSRLFEAENWKRAFTETGGKIIFIAVALFVVLWSTGITNKTWAVFIAGLYVFFIFLKYMCRAVAVFPTLCGTIRIFKAEVGYVLKMYGHTYNISRYKTIFAKGSSRFIFQDNIMTYWYLTDEYGGEPKLIGEEIADTIYKCQSSDIKYTTYREMFYFDHANEPKRLPGQDKNIELMILQFDKFVSVTLNSYTTNVYVPLGKNDKITLDTHICQSNKVRDNFKPEFIKSYLLIHRKRAGLQLIAICQTPQGEWFFAYVVAPTLIFNSDDTHIYVRKGIKYQEKYRKLNVNRKLNGRIIELGGSLLGNWYSGCHIWQYNPDTKELELEYYGDVCSICFDTGEYTKA